MRPADSWKDYELLDATGGNRLERWGAVSYTHLHYRVHMIANSIPLLHKA